MITFLISSFILIASYFIYGSYIDKVFDVDESRPMPSNTRFDGIDYVPMSWPRAFLIQLLNIAGLGPVFGAVLGALFGPVAFLWIVFGGVFIGAVHDYTSGYLSLREGGISLTELIGKYLGNNVKKIMTIVTLVLLMLVGVAFVLGPAKILADMSGSGEIKSAALLTPDSAPTPENQTPSKSEPAEKAGSFSPLASSQFWAIVIFAYYILATLLPIDKLIGRVYPLFGAALLAMVAMMVWQIFSGKLIVPELTFENLHPQGIPVWPIMMITIACGAISGFHATQSPMMARVLTSEKYAKRVFFGAMLVESFIALVWAAAAIGFFHGSTKDLFDAVGGAKGEAVVVVKTISSSLGSIGMILALLGVVALPITTGDTAYRSARLIISDFIKLDQKPLKNRLFIAVPMFVIGSLLCKANFKTIWLYFAWLNQSLSVFTLWAVTVYLHIRGKNTLLTSIPAFFMSTVVISYFCVNQSIGLGLDLIPSTGIGIAFAIIFRHLAYRRSILLEKVVSNNSSNGAFLAPTIPEDA